jgi:hypothetical protein
MSQRFAILAKLIATNTVFNVLVFSWPKEFMLDDFDSFILIYTASNLEVMLYLAYHFAEVIICKDPQPSFVIKGPV